MNAQAQSESIFFVLNFKLQSLHLIWFKSLSGACNSTVLDVRFLWHNFNNWNSLLSFIKFFFCICSVSFYTKLIIPNYLIIFFYLTLLSSFSRLSILASEFFFLYSNSSFTLPRRYARFSLGLLVVWFSVCLYEHFLLCQHFPPYLQHYLWHLAQVFSLQLVSHVSIGWAYVHLSLISELSLQDMFLLWNPQLHWTLHNFVCHPCAGAMLIFSVLFQF